MTGGSKLDLVELATLRFAMGSDDRLGEPDDDEGPTREVTVGRVLVTRTPVTVEQFREFVAATGYETVAEREGSGFVGRYPTHELVPGASWRLPHGPSGESAVGDASVTQVAWIDALEFCSWNNTRLPTEAEWARLSRELGGTLQPAIGTTWEWCHDYYDATHHREEQRVNPTGPHHGTHRVARGGSSRRTERASFFPDHGATDLTFRACTNDLR